MKLKREVPSPERDQLDYAELELRRQEWLGMLVGVFAGSLMITLITILLWVLSL